MPFPRSYPTYPTQQQFLAYINEYMCSFGIRPFFRQEVVVAEHDGEYWCMRTKDAITGPINGGGEESIVSSTREYCSKWLIVATGENADPVRIEGIHSFKGQVMHSSEYRSREAFQGKKVLVVGCGNSGMEVSLDLANHNVHTSMVVRDSVRN
jgi:cation diffusion facilitator CzcD-associated flavoprotein CzcO